MFSQLVFNDFPRAVRPPHGAAGSLRATIRAVSNHSTRQLYLHDPLRSGALRAVWSAGGPRGAHSCAPQAVLLPPAADPTS
eukprot:398787-Alexandrium_andersonii.AAC.1